MDTKATSRSADSLPTSENLEVSPTLVRTMAVMFIGLIVFLAYLVTAFWPVKGSKDDDWFPVVTLFGAWSFQIATDIRLLWIVVFAASLGSYVHTVTSFASYVGNRTLHKSWLWWYVLRTPIGVALALVFYFVIRGGLFSAGALGKDISPFGVAALAGMVGMFSKQATDKLREVFDNLFRTAPGKGDDAREDKLVSAQPTVDSVEPTSVEKGGANLMVRVRGKGFAEGVLVTINGIPRATKFQSETELSATLQPEDLASTGTLDLCVKHPGPPERLSNTVRLVVRDPETGVTQ